MSKLHVPSDLYHLAVRYPILSGPSILVTPVTPSCNECITRTARREPVGCQILMLAHNTVVTVNRVENLHFAS